MKIAYLLLAHNNPAHLQRLISALSTSTSHFFIHIDQKSKIDPFLSIKGNNIHFIQQRVPVFWGDFSQVEATLILLRAALSDRCGFERFVLLSGVDYPLRSASSIERFFENHPNREFMNLVAMPSEAAGKSLSRLTTYKQRPGDPLITRAIRKVLMMAGVVPHTRDYKAYLGDLAPYAGSTWWALSRQACDFILAFVTRETQAVQFFRNTLCPDESFFHTILGNSHFKSRIARNLTYTDWCAGGASPATITEKHLALFQATTWFAPDDTYGAGEMLFARKFADASVDLLARLDRQIAEKEAG
ncbi:MAG: beta-1,6-N-acetylglucosaminyltransferase [Glaciimonas sp.]|nr:beta-1,6-N-acetylglucosaminyltransferase [Glaciimonas sp.]